MNNARIGSTAGTTPPRVGDPVAIDAVTIEHTGRLVWFYDSSQCKLTFVFSLLGTTRRYV